MKTKSYKATFFRHNPQFKNGGYVTERKIEAVSLPSARKRAREISEHCVYPFADVVASAIHSTRNHLQFWLSVPSSSLRSCSACISKAAFRRAGISFCRRSALVRIPRHAFPLK